MRWDETKERFWMFHEPNMSVSAYQKLTPGSGFVWIWMNYVWINCSDYGKVLNMAAQKFTSVWICLDAEYGKVVKMPR